MAGVGPPEHFAGQVLVNVPEVKVLEVNIGFREVPKVRTSC